MIKKKQFLEKIWGSCHFGVSVGLCYFARILFITKISGPDWQKNRNEGKKKREKVYNDFLAFNANKRKKLRFQGKVFFNSRQWERENENVKLCLKINQMSRIKGGKKLNQENRGSQKQAVVKK